MNLQTRFGALLQYPTAVAGLLIIAFLLLLSVYALVTIPYSEAIRLWRGGDEVWRAYPRNAQPAWVNYFTSVKKANTIVLDSANPDHEVVRSERQTSSGTEITYVYTFDFEYDLFPNDLALFFTSQYVEKQPFINIIWETPDGREFTMGDISVRRAEAYRMSQDTRLERRIRRSMPGEPSIEQGLFMNPELETPTVLKGTYQLTVVATLFEPEGDVQAMFIAYGQVYGLAGTDHRRRDLMVPIMWGTPIALSFGLLGAFGTTVLTMLIAATGVWFGGIVDATIQRITEVNIILPILPILIMIATFYGRQIWLILGVIILLSIFGAGIKTFRAIFLQVKEAPFIEAAQAYGSSSHRIITRYMIPRIVPVLIPALVTGIPAFVFLEATLAVLGLGDPVLPTWGKVINDAYSQGALYNGYYYWVLEPAAMLMLTGLAFTLLGFALDRVFNPRLREI